MQNLILAGIVGVAWTAVIWWFFFGPRKSVAAQSGIGGSQEIEVIVQGGYSPSRLVVRRGVPVRLKFRRLESASCSERVLFPDFAVAKKLPQNEVTTIEFTPDRTGTFPFSCAMGMYQGTLVVEEGGRQ